MIPVVYPLGTGSAWNDNELRYSLRSLEFVADLAGVFIVGNDPGFLSDIVTFIPTYHSFGNPARGIMENVLAACIDERVPERFVLMNDDYIFCGEVSLSDFPYWHLGQISDNLKNCSGEYYNHLFVTQQELRKRGLPTLNFDSHYPMIVEKSKMIKVIAGYDWNRQHGLTLKSIYCNTIGIEGAQRPDCKVNQPHGMEWWVGYASQRQVFSIGDSALNGGGLIEFLRRLFEKPCKFESNS